PAAMKAEVSLSIRGGAETALQRYRITNISQALLLSSKYISTMNSESTSGKLSATATLTLTVAEREGCPLSSTTTVSLCFTASLSLTWRIVLISPFCKPTSNSALSVAFCSLYESQAFCPESASTATTLVTR
uniref:Uncharacterized protein n=1 Tax=Hucho hucho TaxID=62062 RepID=A0A4W5QML1_9TELE